MSIDQIFSYESLSYHYEELQLSLTSTATLGTQVFIFQEDI